MCRAASDEYKLSVELGEKSDRSLVSIRKTNKARARVQSWVDAGVPKREISRATGVGRRQLTTLLTGKHPSKSVDAEGGYKPSRKMSQGNYEKIMNCEFPIAPAARQRVDAKSLNAAIGWLDEHGVSRADVAKRSGINKSTIYSLGKHGKCEYDTLAKMAAAAEDLKGMAS